MDQSDLQLALTDGDPGEVSRLIEAGADIRYACDEGYDALIDAVHGRDVARDPRLLDLLKLLINHGVNLSSVTSHCESGLRVLSRLGRFDAVQALLEAGADKTQLGWTPLIEAVALGSISDMEALLDRGEALEGRDWWHRTAWLVAILKGDIAKSRLLRDRGANTNACGPCGCPPLFYAIQGHHPKMLRWLLECGVSVHQVDEFDGTALMEAVEHDDLECVEILLDAGSKIDADVHGTALNRAASRGVIKRLLDAGADPADANQRVILGLSDPEEGEEVGDELASVSSDEFHKTAGRSFGSGNPEQMRVPFWEAMIRSGASAYAARERLGGGGVNEPVWCARRFGQSLTPLPDGRVVQIGGEHEDSYDPDFCIYNDVFIHEPNGSICIYGYPEAVFPPTDFHTATLVGDFIYVIGCLGYGGTREQGAASVYRLDTRSLRMERLETSGEGPGWIYKHRASLVDPGVIRVWGGVRADLQTGRESHNPNSDAFLLDLDRLRWRRDTG